MYYYYTRNLKTNINMKKETLTVKEIKLLPSLVTYENLPGYHWEGKSDGIIHEGLYLKVYPAYSCDWKFKSSYKKTSFINVPLTRVSANQFKDRIIKEGLLLGINQDIEVKPSKDLFKVKFLLDKSRPRKKDLYTESWCESNMDGSFAYNGVTDDF